MNEQELASQIKTYQELKKQDKNIDVASLALAALQSKQAESLSPREKRWAYLISLAVPPFGLLFAFKFYTSGKADGKNAAYMCVGLTVLAIALFLVSVKMMFATTGTSLDQLQQINPQDYQDLLR